MIIYIFSYCVSVYLSCRYGTYYISAIINDYIKIIIISFDYMIKIMKGIKLYNINKKIPHYFHHILKFHLVLIHQS